jgi:hypothetical protein
MVVLGGGFVLLWCTWHWLRARSASAGEARPVSRHDDPARAGADAAMTGEWRRFSSPGGEVSCVACGSPWPAGTLFCDCGEETEEDDPEAVEAERELCVLTVQSSWSASLAQSFLAGHGVPSQLRWEELDGAELGRIDVFVAAEHAVRARDLLRRQGAWR